MADGGILILDDDDVARMQLMTIIADSRYGLLGVRESASIETGLRIIKGVHPHVIFWDPSTQNGSEDLVYHIMRLSSKSAVVIVTQLKMFDIAYHAINAGCRGYLLKPVLRTEVMNLLERLVDMSGEVPRTVIDLGDPIQSAVQYMEHHFSESITLADMARMVYLSPSYFSRQFKLEMQLTFVEYLTKLRINHAKQLLRKTDLPIDVVAEESGFHRASYFTTLFRRLQNVSPSEYRRCFRERLRKSQ